MEVQLKAEAIVLQILRLNQTIEHQKQKVLNNRYGYIKLVADKILSGNTQNDNKVAKLKMQLVLLGEDPDSTIEFYKINKIAHRIIGKENFYTLVPRHESFGIINWSDPPTDYYTERTQTNRSLWKGDSPYSSKARRR